MQIENIEISHPDKIIFSEKNISKRDMLTYYSKIAKYILPYLKNRPLTLQRFPDGIDQNGFYQKNASKYFPDFIERVEIKTEDGTNEQVICNDKKSLIYLVNQGTVSFHTWLSKYNELQKPNKVIIDLDPSDNDFNKVKKAAKVIKDFFEVRYNTPKLMTTGKNGLHIWCYINPDTEFDDVRTTLKKNIEELVKAHPDLLTAEVRKEDRNGKIFIDYLRNAYGQTSVCPYSLRANSECGIATPIKWSELNRLSSAGRYSIDNIFRRLGQIDSTFIEKGL
jgi:bifunctional non-homologous end joining protein LigD